MATHPVPVDLVAALAGVADPRARRGVRHRCATILVLGACAVLAGAKTFTAIGEGAGDLIPTVRHRLELGRRAPCESTMGVDSSVATTMSSTWSAVIVLGRPGRASSVNPSSRCSTNRARHLPTVAAGTPQPDRDRLVVRPVGAAQHDP